MFDVAISTNANNQLRYSRRDFLPPQHDKLYKLIERFLEFFVLQKILGMTVYMFYYLSLCIAAILRI